MSEVQTTIRLLIADDSEETRASVRKLLALEDGIEVVGEARNGLEAVEKTKLLRPDIVLMDVRMPELDGFGATEAIVADVPHTQVITMSVSGTAELIRRAMLAGAREYLVKPFEPDELVACVRRVHELHGVPAEPDPAPSRELPSFTPPSARRGKVVAIFSPKGGVGSTTVACNLAAYLANGRQRRTVLVDGCMRFGDVAMTLGLRQEHTIADLAGFEAAEIDREMVEGVLVAHKSGLRVLLPPLTPDQAGVIAPATFRHILSQLRAAFDFVVVDLSSALVDTDLEAIEEADQVITLFTPELTALKRLKLFRDLAKERNLDPDKLLMVGCQVEEAFGVRLADAELSLQFKTALCIRNDRKLATLALNRGMPFVLTHAHSSLAQSIEELAGLVTSTAEPAESEAKTDKAREKGRFGTAGGNRRRKEAAA